MKFMKEEHEATIAAHSAICMESKQHKQNTNKKNKQLEQKYPHRKIESYACMFKPKDGAEIFHMVSLVIPTILNDI